MVDFMLYNKVKIMISYVKSYEGLHMIYYLCSFVIFKIKVWRISCCKNIGNITLYNIGNIRYYPVGTIWDLFLLSRPFYLYHYLLL